MMEYLIILHLVRPFIIKIIEKILKIRGLDSTLKLVI